MRFPSVLTRSLYRSGQALTALPRSLVTLATAFGSTGSAPARRGVANALLTAVVGLVAWFVAFLGMLALARGPLYGLVDRGPYDDSWGGPSLAGAWAVHALVALPFVPIAVCVLVGIDALVRRLHQRIVLGQGPRWPVPVALVVSVAAAFFFVSWLNQL